MIGIVAVLLTAGVTDRFRLTGRCTPRVIFSRTFSIAAGTFRPVLGVVVFLHRKIVAGRCKPAGTGFPRFQISKLRGAVCCSVESATGALIVALPAIHRATRSLTADRRCVSTGVDRCSHIATGVAVGVAVTVVNVILYGAMLLAAVGLAEMGVTIRVPIAPCRGIIIV